MTAADARPIVLVTGAAGNLGRSVAKAMADGYRIVGLDLKAREMGKGPDDRYPILAVDLQSDESVTSALQSFRDAHGSRIANIPQHSRRFFPHQIGFVIERCHQCRQRARVC